MNPDIREYHRSITREIDSIKNRVRYLIGDRHWGEEGRYKEAVFRSVLRRFLPSNISLGTGFVVNSLESQDEMAISKQIDIIVYDNTYPVLFSEGDFIVTTPANVRGIVEVKTRMSYGHLKDIVSAATDNGRLVGKQVFNGIFSFDGFDDNAIPRSLETVLRSSDGIVNHLSIGCDVFIKYWEGWATEAASTGREYRIYHIEDYSFTYFFSNLLEDLSKDRLKERWWFQYPIREGKESFVVSSVSLHQ